MGDPNSIIEYGLPGLFSIGVHILSDTGVRSYNRTKHISSQPYYITQKGEKN